jgi:hypothetical protein
MKDTLNINEQPKIAFSRGGGKVAIQRGVRETQTLRHRRY